MSTQEDSSSQEGVKKNVNVNEKPADASPPTTAENESKELQTAEGEVAADAPEEEYPSSLKLAFVVVALVLSIFFFSLDQVRLHADALEDASPWTPLTKLRD